MPRISITLAATKIIGGAGFVGFLVAAHYLPALTTPMRVAALLWFFGLGGVYVMLSWRRPRIRRRDM